MKAEQHISFLADLLNLIRELDTLVKDYCRYLTTDQDGSFLDPPAFVVAPFCTNTQHGNVFL